MSSIDFDSFEALIYEDATIINTSIKLDVLKIWLNRCGVLFNIVSSVSDIKDTGYRKIYWVVKNSTKMQPDDFNLCNHIKTIIFLKSCQNINNAIKI
jgi:hypothetical protein